MSLSLSIIIPTYNRPDYLKVCLDSCLSQDFLPMEILIGDDSPGEQTAEMIANYPTPDGVNLRYFHHCPSKKQALNVAFLLEQAQGDVVGLMHDDDFYLPGAFKHLIKPLQNPNIAASFGLQKVFHDDLTFDEEQTELLQKEFLRTPEFDGEISNKAFSAFVLQFPNNGWFVRHFEGMAELYKKAVEFSTACDASFGFFLSQTLQGSYFLVDQYTAGYRLSEISEIRGTGQVDTGGLGAYWASYNMKGIDWKNPHIKNTILSRAISATCASLALKQYFQALRVMLGRHLGWRLFFTLNGWRWIYRHFLPAFTRSLKNK